ncbi:serine protease, partial [Myxococcus sp. AM010]|nr:serine protease [Myxococcus sp. AM010]
MHEWASWRIIPLMPSSSRASRWSALLLLPLLGCAGGGTQQGRRQHATSRQAVASRQPTSALPAAKDFSRDMVAAHNLARSRAQPAPKP